MSRNCPIWNSLSWATNELYTFKIWNQKEKFLPFKIQRKNINFYQSAIPIDLLRSLPLAIQGRVLKHYLYRNTGRILGFQYIEQICLSCLFHTYSSKHFLTRLLDTCHDERQGLEVKKRKFVTPWILFPGGIKLLIRKNYILLFYQRESFFTPFCTL